MFKALYNIMDKEGEAIKNSLSLHRSFILAACSYVAFPDELA
jgi:hypothetical protein